MLGRSGACGRNNSASASVREVGIDNTILDTKVAPDDYRVEEVRKLVLLNRSTDRTSHLMPPLGSVQTVRISICGVQRTISEKPTASTVDVVPTAACYCVDYSTHSAAKLRRKTI